MALTPDAAGAVIGELNRRIEALRAGRYEGRDKAGLAVVKVDGEGLVCDVTLSKSISRYRSDAVSKAVHEALLAAQMSLTQAYESLAVEAEKMAAGDSDG
jgi:DNA-binding protein YbaB